MSSIEIANVSIPVNENGLFSLSALHKASGSESKNQPSKFLENKKTKELVEEMKSNTGIPVLEVNHGGKNQGTYVAKEIVYAYAMWISPKFNLMVIRAFDALTKGDTAKAESIAQGRAEMTSKDKFELLSSMYESLGVTGSTQLQLTRKFAEDQFPDLIKYLPYYGVDTQSDIPQGSTERVASATLLLKENKANLSAVKFNKMAISSGLIEEKDRLTTSSKTQKIKWLTEKGLKYGVNRMDERNRNQIHWYEGTFKEVLETILA